MPVGGQRHAPDALHPGKIRYPLCRRLSGSKGRSGRVRKISPPPGFDPRTIQPVASRYADCAIPVRLIYNKVSENTRFHLLNLFGSQPEDGYMKKAETCRRYDCLSFNLCLQIIYMLDCKIMYILLITENTTGMSQMKIIRCYYPPKRQKSFIQQPAVTFQKACISTCQVCLK